MKRTALLLVLLLGPVAHAQVYKWVDANGKTHYGDKPTDAGTAEQMKIAPPPPARPASAQSAPSWQGLQQEAERRRALDEFQKDAQQAPSGPSDEQRCAAARRTQDTFNGRPVYRVNQQGERVYIEDAERAQIEKRANEAVAKYCKR